MSRPGPSRPSPAQIEASRRILREAARLLSEEGWIQGELDSLEGRCLLGAIIDACFLDENQPQPFAAAWLVARHLDIGGGGPVAEAGWSAGLVCWNDTPGRSAEEVILALKRAAE